MAKIMNLVASIAPAALAAATDAPAILVPDAAPVADDTSTACTVITGDNVEARTLAFWRIAPLAYSDAQGRKLAVTNLKTVLGAAPDAALKDAARVEFLAGFMSGALAKTIDYCRALVTSYAACGTTAALRDTQKGRRTPAQEKAYGAARQRYSLLLADAGHGKAQTQKAKKAKDTAKEQGAKAGRPAGQGAGKSTKVVTPTHAELEVSKAKLDSVDAVCAYVDQLKASLLLVANKHAAHLPTDYGLAITNFVTKCNAAANALQERKAKAGNAA